LVDLKTCIGKIVDACNPSLTPDQIDSALNIVYVGSDEPNSGGGSGNISSDIVKAGPHIVNLRAERDGTKDGRVYHVGITYTNPQGSATTYDCRYGVPHDNSGSKAVDSWTYPPGDARNPGFNTYYPPPLASQP
jgi:hypothetical protein